MELMAQPLELPVHEGDWLMEIESPLNLPCIIARADKPYSLAAFTRETDDHL